MSIRKRLPMLALAGACLAGGMFVPRAADARVSLSLNLGGSNELDGFLSSASSYYNTPEETVYLMRRRGLSEDEIPVVLYLASRANVSPMRIADLRLQGMQWMDIAYEYGMNPDAFYIEGMDSYDYSSYGPSYSIFSRPRYEWRSLRLSDRDIVNLVNTRFMSSAYRMAPREIIRMRARGSNFASIGQTIHQQIAVQTGQAPVDQRFSRMGQMQQRQSARQQRDQQMQRQQQLDRQQQMQQQAQRQQQIQQQQMQQQAQRQQQIQQQQIQQQDRRQQGQGQVRANDQPNRQNRGGNGRGNGQGNGRHNHGG